MKPNMLMSFSSVLFASALLLSGLAGAQVRTPRLSSAAPAYDLTRETLLEGTLLKYTENSSVPPIGAHLTVQTPSGTVDVHVGDARFLKLNQFKFAEGSTIRVVGESLEYGQGKIFFARVIQQGGQRLAVRSMKGMPLWPAGARAQLAAGAKLLDGGAR
jgi:hypothetical protein